MTSIPPTRNEHGTMKTRATNLHKIQLILPLFIVILQGVLNNQILMRMMQKKDDFPHGCHRTHGVRGLETAIETA